MCRGRLPPEVLFFALVADVSPEGVELRAAHLVITEQDLFDLLHLRRGLDEPGADGLFLDAFDAMDGGERIPVPQHRKALDDCLLVVFFAVEDCAFGLGCDLIAGPALPPLTTFAREAELAQVPGVYAPIMSALLVPAKGGWMR